MPATKGKRSRQVRRSVTLPPRIAKQVDTIAKQRALSENRVLVELIEQGIAAERQKEKAFFQLAERFRAASDPEQVKQLGNELGRFVFGEGFLGTMPQIESWLRLPAAIRDHLVERMRDATLTLKT